MRERFVKLMRTGTKAPRLGALLAFAIVGLAGCNVATTEDANAQANANWVGKPVNAFFSTYGPPKAEHALGTGGKIYTWRGGEKYVPKPQLKPQPSNTITRELGSSSSSSTQVSGNSVTTTTRSASANVSIDVDNLMSMMITGKPKEEPKRLVYCEMQITTDRTGTITKVSATGDTSGAGFSGSRCSEMMQGKV
jgi:hypothetical protein